MDKLVLTSRDWDCLYADCEREAHFPSMPYDSIGAAEVYRFNFTATVRGVMIGLFGNLLSYDGGRTCEVGDVEFEVLNDPDPIGDIDFKGELESACKRCYLSNRYMKVS